MYTFCTGSSYAYLIDTAATTSSGYFQRFNIGSTTYSAHFYHDTIYQTYGNGGTAGGYGSVRKWAWTGNNTVNNVWTYTLSGAHHDICPMPNGNVLVIVDESKVPSSVGGTSSSTVKSPVIREIKPTGSTTGTVVWEWHLWDHLCQSTNSAYPATYVTNIAQHPERFNVNCTTNGGITSDWFHMNGIDYNPTLDQIAICSHVKEEIYVIDHSTTTAEAATHAGGKSGKGGDFLYRWGSPENYGCTTDGNGISLNTIHDCRWVPATNLVWPNYLSVLHNNSGGNAQAVLHLPPYSTSNPYNYTYAPGSVVGPSTCVKPTIPNLSIQGQGGCQALDNGNILMTVPNSKFVESRNSTTALQSITVSTTQSDRLKKTDVFGPWITATATSDTLCAGSMITLNCNIKSAPVISNPVYTYSWVSVPATSSFSSASDQNPTAVPSVAGTYTYLVTVSMSGTFNSNTITTTTTAFATVVVEACTGMNENSTEKASLTIYPNPTSGIININEEFALNNDYEVKICSSFGDVVFCGKNSKMINLSDFANGIYYLSVKTSDNNLINKKIILIK